MEIGKNFSNFTKSISHYVRSVDLILYATAVAISIFGILNIYGVAGAESIFVKKQILFVLIGVSAMVIISFFNYRYLKNYSFPVLIVYLAALFLLIITIVSPPVRGIHAWIVIGGFTFEPSELIKLALIVLLAKYFSQRHIHIHQFKHIVISGIYCAIPALIIFRQPDLGSAAIIILIWFSILMAAGISKKHFFILVLVALIASYGVWSFVLKPYQQDRILSFINPYSDPAGTGYNIIQSKIAIGSGGWFGRGLGKGSQATLGFLPEAHNDFAFSAVAEQFGFVSIFILLGLVFILLSRIFLIGERAYNNFGKLFALGMGLFIFFHIFISAAVNSGLMPITGIPFSLLSYGGSHIISVMIGLGILQSIKRHG